MKKKTWPGGVILNSPDRILVCVLKRLARALDARQGKYANKTMKMCRLIYIFFVVICLVQKTFYLKMWLK